MKSKNIISIIYEDNYIIAVTKPNNVLVHNSYYARNIREKTLIKLLEEQLNIRIYPIHRLDRKTSGVILLSKQKENVHLFQRLFLDNLISKKYLAIVRGFTNKKGVISTPVKHPETKQHKDAITFYKTISSIELDIPVHPYPKSRYSLIELQPKTGRTHQLRIHLNKISHPIIGDYKYGDRFHNRMFEKELEENILFLHATNIKFTHPINNKEINIVSNISNSWENIFKLFSWQYKI